MHKVEKCAEWETVTRSRNIKGQSDAAITTVVSLSGGSDFDIDDICRHLSK